MSVSPPRSCPVRLKLHGCPARELYAVVVSLCAPAATASASCIVPGGTTIPGGNPVTAVPGLTPTSPLITVGPVFVTAELPSTAKDAAVPSEGAVAADRVCTEAVERR